MYEMGVGFELNIQKKIPDLRDVCAGEHVDIHRQHRHPSARKGIENDVFVGDVCETNAMTKRKTKMKAVVGTWGNV